MAAGCVTTAVAIVVLASLTSVTVKVYVPAHAPVIEELVPPEGDHA
jgi:hypothetical protein